MEKDKKKSKVGIKEYRVRHESQLLEYLLNDLGFNHRNAKNLLTHQLISINKKTVSQYNYQLSEGDILEIGLKPIQMSLYDLDIPIIYEDDDFIVINKPHGLLSIANDQERLFTAYRSVNEYVQKKNKDQRIFILHRIDRDTSGVLVFCKNEKLRDALQDNWNQIVTKRGYYAIVEGKMAEKEMHLVNYLKTNQHDYTFVVDKPDKTCHKAITEYKVIEENDEYSLLDVNIKTGRKNQIRVVLGHLGHNIIGDNKYGKAANPLKRLGLHAYQLTFVNPTNKREYSFKAPMPKEFKKVFNNERNNKNNK